MKNAREWRELYAKERAALGDRGLAELVEGAADVELRPGGAFVFPHTFLSGAGRFIAAAARAVVRSGAEEVLAIGVLHSVRAGSEALLERARGGDVLALEELRRVHLVDGHAESEYSLDGFVALLDVAARAAGRKPPRVHARFPFLVGDDPQSLPGIDELARLVGGGCAVVATADPIHHGAGYGTPPAERRALDDEATLAWSRETIQRQHGFLVARDWAGFQAEALKNRCDFRDAGPVLASLLAARGDFTLELSELALVDYAATLDADAPTWVAAAFSVAQARP